MQVIHVKDYQEMSEKAAEMLFSRIEKSNSLTLGLATGGTPEETYKRLVEKAADKQQSFSHIETFNLDEYVGLSGNDDNSYRHYMNTHLFNKVDIPKEQTHLPNGLAEALDKECKEYDQLIKQAGGIDIQLLGIGGNGHIGFNEPGTSFATGTHIVELAEETRAANARYFSNLSSVPTQAITMGIATIMQAKEILLLVSGHAKAEAFAQLMSKQISESFPASALNDHSNVTIIADEAASSIYASQTVL